MKLKQSLLKVAAALVACVLPSCLQHEVTLTMQKDGSGTLVEETTFGAQMLAMMSQMSGMGEGAGKQADPVKDLVNEEKLKEKAEKMGAGVTLEKAERLGKSGARVTYHFKDINQLKYNSMSNGPLGNQAGVQIDESAKAKEEPIAFHYAGGKLVIEQKKPKKDKKDEVAKKQAEAKAKAMEDPAAMAMMKPMLQDLKFGFKVVIPSGIRTTDASIVKDNEITLANLDMGALIKDEAQFKKFMKVGAEQDDPQAAMDALKGIPGIEFESKEQVTVQVK